MSKEEKLKELENEFKAKQIKMSEEIKLEIRHISESMRRRDNLRNYNCCRRKPTTNKVGI